MALRLITLLFVARLVLQVAQIIKWRAHSPRRRRRADAGRPGQRDYIVRFIGLALVIFFGGAFLSRAGFGWTLAVLLPLLLIVAVTSLLGRRARDRRNS